MRFLCDEMLGHLARDLRILGYDTVYRRDVADELLLREARADARRLVTRDRRLAARAGPDGVPLRALDPAEQLDELVRVLGLKPAHAAFLSRCTACNGELDEVPAGGLAEVPPGVHARGASVHRCRACGHVYWEGTHVEAMRARLGRYLS